MHIGLLRSHHVEKTAAQVIEKQEKIDKLQESRLGRFWLKITHTPTDYALRKLGSITETDPRQLELKKVFIRDLMANPEKAANNLNLVEQYAIHEYSAVAFVGMNDALRNPQGPNANDQYYLSLNVEAMKALRKLSKEQDHFGLTFRGLGGKTEHADLKRGDTLTEKAFMSTSTNVKTSRGFAVNDGLNNSGTMLYSFGQSGANIVAQSSVKGESEVLYPAGTKFNVLLSVKDHEATAKGFRGRPQILKTNHVVLEEIGTPANKGHSGILDALDLAR